MIPVGKASSKPILNSALDFNAANRELKQACSTRTLLRGWAWWGCSALSPSTSNCPEWGAWNLSCKVVLLQQKHIITYHHLPSTKCKTGYHLTLHHPHRQNSLGKAAGSHHEVVHRYSYCRLWSGTGETLPSLCPEVKTPSELLHVHLQVPLRYTLLVIKYICI